MTETTQTQDVVPPAPTNSGDAAPSATPVAPVSESAAPVTAPEAATTEPVAPAPAPAPEPKDAATSVMGDAKPAETTEAKPDAKPEAKAETKPETKSEPKAETSSEEKTETVLPTYEDFKLPENFGADKESLGEFTKLLGELEIGKFDHKTMQEKGQALVDLGIKAVNQSIERLNDYYVQIHEKQKTDWKDAFKKDPEIGGDNIKTTISNLGDAIESYGGTPEQIKELREQMDSSGYGNYPQLIRLINNMQAKINSYTKETQGGIIPGQRPAPSKVKPYQQFYSKA